MEIQYQGHSKRKQRAVAFWNKVISEYNAGKSAGQIAQENINPYTNKPYARESIYWILNKFKKGN